MGNNDTIHIPSNAKIKVYWDDTTENYTREAKNRVRAHFSKKYGVNRKNVNVIFRPVKIDEHGNTIDMCQAGIDNIMDINYQRKLFKEWLDRENKVVDFDRLLALDDKVNSALKIEEVSTRQRKYNLKWIKINNLLCFGDNEPIHFNKLKGITIIVSEPKNQGGKTTFSMEAVRYLLFGTTSKSDRNEELFNSFSNNNEVLVRGGLEIEDDEFIIERKLTRRPTKDGGYTVKGSVEYFQLMSDGSEKDLKGEESSDTLNKIKDTIGNETDFEIIISANAKNLEDLIDTKPTERGKLLTRFIGLEPIEEKERKARDLYNEFAKKMTSNQYDIIQLETEITEHNESIVELNTILTELNTSVSDTKKEIDAKTAEKEALIGRKHNIDDEIIKLNPTTLNEKMTEYTNEGNVAAVRMKNIQTRLDEIGEVVFDEDLHQQLITEDKTVSISRSKNNSEVVRLTGLIEDLKNSEICYACNRPLEGVDNSGKITAHTQTIETLNKTIAAESVRLSEIESELLELTETKKLVNEKNNSELERDKLEVEIASLRNKFKEKRNQLKQFNLNNDAIKMNQEWDLQIAQIQTKIQTLEFKRDGLIKNVQLTETDIENNINDIAKKEVIIEKIKKEDQIEKIFKIYIDMVGKRGISKLVLRSVIPIINAELHRLLDDVTNFDVELYLNDKNDVEFLLIMDGVEKKLKSASGLEKFASSIALRTVLGRVSYLPKPNFLQFDEIFGPVANENLDGMKSLFDKILDWYDTIMLITHNDIVKDWGDHIVTIKKINNISTISTK
jgi:DNA repair exonuclease SbcCD ATPase subunit